MFGAAERSWVAWGVVLVVLVQVFSGCSSADGEIVTPLTGTTAAIAITPTTSSVPTTAAAPATSRSTTMASTAAATLEQLRADQGRFLNGARNLEIDLKASPIEADVGSLEMYLDGDALSDVVGSVREHAENGTAVRRSSKNLERVEVESVALIDNEQAALVIYCLISDVVVIEVATGSIIDDSVVSLSITSIVELNDGDFRQVSRSALTRSNGEGC
jgi:predicted lipid-binding transport protein (Tim44 family)